ncbi:MAG: ATP-binding protein [Albidovulum sp.]
MTSQSFSQIVSRIAPRIGYLAVAAMLLAFAAYALTEGVVTTAAVVTAGILALSAVSILWFSTRQNTVEKALQAQVAAFIRHESLPCLITDNDGEVTTQNRVAHDRFGMRVGQTLANTLSGNFANPSAVISRIHIRALATGSAQEDLVTRRGNVRLAAQRVGEGGFLWRFDDTAERFQTGRGADNISLPMLTASHTGTILFMNDAVKRLVGRRVKSLDRIFVDLPLRSGEEHEIAGVDGPVRVLAVCADTSAGRREIFLLPPRKEHEGFVSDPTAFDALPVALLRLTSAGQVCEANRAARGLLGDIEVNTKVSQIFEGLGRSVNDWLADAVAGRTESMPEVLRVAHAEKETYLQVTLTRTVTDGRLALVAVLSDATQLKTLEAQFVQSQKMQAIGQLAGGVAHDFNNLLTAISGYCDLLLLRHSKNDLDYADLVQINQNANRAASLVGQLLAFSRKQTLKPKVIDLRDTLSDLTHLLNRLVGEKIRLTFTHDPALRHLRADKRQLEQVIMNLVVNARDAMPDGGDIKIETVAVRLNDPLIRDRATVAPGDYVVVRVTDVGSGIAPDKLTKIFEPFFTTKRQGEGTGLGLSTAYGIVKQSGGFIFCDSVVGSGTTFSLYFPAHDSAQTDDVMLPPVPAKRATRSGEGVVLLVEDEAPVRAFASRALRMRGYTVIEAENAEEALKTLEDRSLAVDIFVTDVIMPGMDGPSWVREALKQRPNTRVVFVSGYAEESLTETRECIPNSVFLPKPFSLSELTATVQGQIH